MVVRDIDTIVGFYSKVANLVFKPPSFDPENPEAADHWSECYSLLRALRPRLVCSICRNVVLDPQNPESCDHHFCRPCIEAHISQHEKCPVCHLPAKLTDLRSSSRLAPLVFLYREAFKIVAKCSGMPLEESDEWEEKAQKEEEKVWDGVREEAISKGIEGQGQGQIMRAIGARIALVDRGRVAGPDDENLDGRGAQANLAESRGSHSDEPQRRRRKRVDTGWSSDSEVKYPSEGGAQHGQTEPHMSLQAQDALLSLQLPGPSSSNPSTPRVDAMPKIKLLHFASPRRDSERERGGGGERERKGGRARRRVSGRAARSADEGSSSEDERGDVHEERAGGEGGEGDREGLGLLDVSMLDLYTAGYIAKDQPVIRGNNYGSIGEGGALVVEQERFGSPTEWIEFSVGRPRTARTHEYAWMKTLVDGRALSTIRREFLRDGFLPAQKRDMNTRVGRAGGAANGEGEDVGEEEGEREEEEVVAKGSKRERKRAAGAAVDTSAEVSKVDSEGKRVRRRRLGDLADDDTSAAAQPVQELPTERPRKKSYGDQGDLVASDGGQKSVQTPTERRPSFRRSSTEKTRLAEGEVALAPGWVLVPPKPPQEMVSLGDGTMLVTVVVSKGESKQVQVSEGANCKVGSRVLAKWSDGMFYPGTVMKLRPVAKRVEVAFDDGDLQSIPADHVKVATSDGALGLPGRLRKTGRERGGRTRGGRGKEGNDTGATDEDSTCTNTETDTETKTTATSEGPGSDRSEDERVSAQSGERPKIVFAAPLPVPRPTPPPEVPPEGGSNKRPAANSGDGRRNRLKLLRKQSADGENAKTEEGGTEPPVSAPVVEEKPAVVEEKPHPRKPRSLRSLATPTGNPRPIRRVTRSQDAVTPPPKIEPEITPQSNEKSTPVLGVSQQPQPANEISPRQTGSDAIASPSPKIQHPPVKSDTGSGASPQIKPGKNSPKTHSVSQKNSGSGKKSTDLVPENAPISTKLTIRLKPPAEPSSPVKKPPSKPSPTPVTDVISSKPPEKSPKITTTTTTTTDDTTTTDTAMATKRASLEALQRPNSSPKPPSVGGPKTMVPPVKPLQFSLRQTPPSSTETRLPFARPMLDAGPLELPAITSMPPPTFGLTGPPAPNPSSTNPRPKPPLVGLSRPQPPSNRPPVLNPVRVPPVGISTSRSPVIAGQGGPGDPRGVSQIRPPGGPPRQVPSSDLPPPNPPALLRSPQPIPVRAPHPNPRGGAPGNPFPRGRAPPNTLGGGAPRPRPPQTSQISKIPNRPGPVITTSLLDPSQKETVRTALMRLGGTLKNIGGSEVWDPSITHLVTGTLELNKDGVKKTVTEKRTMRYMLAVAARVWVVSMHWVVESIKANRWLDEAHYEVTGDQLAYSAPTHARQAKLCNLPGLFHTLSIYLCGDYVLGTKDQRHDLEKLVELEGGRVISREEYLSMCDERVRLKREGKPIKDGKWVHPIAVGGFIMKDNLQVTAKEAASLRNPEAYLIDCPNVPGGKALDAKYLLDTISTYSLCGIPEVWK